MSQKPFVLIDGSSYLYRAFHALPPLTNSQGIPTGAIYGVINMIRKLRAEYHPDYMAVIFDAKGKTFRDELFAAYKMHRPSMPDDLRVQIEPLHNIIRAMGLPLIIVDGVEADDVIGTLVKQAEQKKLSVLISTGDKDMAQLVSEQVTLINTMNNSLLDPEKVLQKFGVTPAQIIDYLALIGDTSDNVPGIPSVGPKTAAKWLQQYGSLEKLVAHADDITGKVGEKLREHIGQLSLSQQLVTLKTDLKLPVELDDLKPTTPDHKILVDIFKTLEFKTWLSESLAEKNQIEHQYEIITTIAAFEAVIHEIQQTKIFAVDTETTDLNTLNAQLVGISLATKPHRAFYIPVGHDYPDVPNQLPLTIVLAKLKPLLENPHIQKITHNLKYDMGVFANYEITFNGTLFDTMLESYVLNSIATRHNMDALALKYLDYKTIHYEDIAGKGTQQLSFNQIPFEQAGPYAAEDADITLQLHQTLWPKIVVESGLQTVFEQIEMPLVPVLSRMERHGVFVDSKMLAIQSEKIAERLKIIQVQAFELAGEVFNLDSPKQLQTILFEKLGLPILHKTPKGQASTAEATLQELAFTFELPKILLEHRSLSKLKSTYTDRLPEQIHPTTQRIHTSYQQAVTSTGRLSSTEPNLQNIPVRTEEGQQIRKAFIAPLGRKILSADYSQIELRIMAHFSADPGLISAFQHNLDIHRATAAEVFSVTLEQVTATQRRDAKTINFGLIYGMSAFGLSKQLGTDRQTAQAYIDRYFTRYPGMQDYMQRTRAYAHQHGYVETLFGRRLYIPDIHSTNQQRVKAAERIAINAPMQGTAADIIKLAMIQMDNWIQRTKTDAKMIMQVHDELVLEVAENVVAVVQKKLVECMTSCVTLHVPIQVEAGFGDSWYDAHN